MKCQRCCGREEAAYRVRSDIIDMKAVRPVPTKPGDWGLLLKCSVAEKEKATEKRVSLNGGMTGQKSYSIADGEGDRTSLLLEQSISSFFFC